MATNEHGSCTHCGYDFNGDYIYDTFLEKYNGDHQKALETAEMYGASKDQGRWGKHMHMKPYDNYNKLKPYWICPECKGVQ